MTSQDNTIQALIVDERDYARASGQTFVNLGMFTHDGSGWIHDPTITADQFRRMRDHAPKPRPRSESPRAITERREPKRIGDGRAPLETLPLFAPDNLLGAALLGPDRVEEWKQLAPLLETRGLPKIDQMMGGRFVPAVRAFFMRQYGLGTSTALAPDGVEDFETWKQKPKRPV